MTTTKPSPDVLARLQEEFDGALMLLAEDDLEARDIFAQRIQRNDTMRRRIIRLRRAAGLGDPPSYRPRVSVVRETEVAS